jgi:hypothetical protein
VGIRLRVIYSLDGIAPDRLTALLLPRRDGVAFHARRELLVGGPFVQQAVGELGADVKNLGEALELHLRAQTRSARVDAGTERQVLTVPNCVTGMRM